MTVMKDTVKKSDRHHALSRWSYSAAGLAESAQNWRPDVTVAVLRSPRCHRGGADGDRRGVLRKLGTAGALRAAGRHRDTDPSPGGVVSRERLIRSLLRHLPERRQHRWSAV